MPQTGSDYTPPKFRPSGGHMMTMNFSQPSKGQLTFPKPHTEGGMEHINFATSHTKA